MNRHYGKLDDNNKIVYAPKCLSFEGCVIGNPTADDYHSCGFLDITDIPPEKVGVTFSPTEYGDMVDGVIRRRYNESPIVAPVKVYSVEEIIYGLIERNVLKEIKNIVGDYWELFTMRETISADNEIWGEMFPSLKAAIIASGVLTEDDIIAILADAEV